MEAIERQTLDKIHHIRSIMEETSSHRRPGQFQKTISASGGQRRSGHKVGIFCSEEMNTGWLREVLHSNLFNEQVRKFECIIFKDKKNIKEDASKYTFCIYLCNRRNWIKILSPSLGESVKILLGLRPLIVVILDVKDSGEEGKRRILQTLNSIGIESRHLFLFSRPEQDAYTQNLNLKIQTEPETRGPAVGTVKQKKDTLFCTLQRKLTIRSKKGYRPPISNLDTPDLDRFVHLSIPSPTHTQINTHNKEEYAPSSSNPVPPEIEPSQRDVVGIFSRSSSDDYSWLVELLTSEYFRDRIQEVRPCYITNNGSPQFVKDLSQCTFGILYHTKNRGRINITDVTSSLYDEELGYLNRTLGKDNVLVVVDDLEDSSNQEKTRILKNQPSIGKLASDLLLISHTEKADNMQLVRKLKSIKHPCHSSENFSKRRLQKVTFQKEGQEQKALPTNSQKTPTSARLVIGVFSVSEEGNISWLRRLLSSDTFGQREVTYHKMPSYDNVGLEEGKLQCVVAILYHTMKTGPAHTPQGEFLYHKVTDQLVQKLGKDNVIVLIDDLQSVADRKWVMWIKSKIEKLAGDLLYITQEEKYSQERLVQGLKSLKLFRQPPEYRTRTDPVQHKLGKLNTKSAPATSVIGIFSRSENSKCNWLERLLSSKEFGNHQVIFHQTSPSNMKGFQSMVSHCKFGILYHCIDRGYKYLTDHENSLYDEELLYLSTRIGKSRVIVVMDEVGNSDKEAKSWTLENQPSLGMLARDVLLFTKSENTLYQKRNRSMHADKRLTTVYEKLNTLKEILEEGMTSTSFSNSKEDFV